MNVEQTLIDFYEARRRYDESTKTIGLWLSACEQAKEEKAGKNKYGYHDPPTSCLKTAFEKAKTERAIDRTFDHGDWDMWIEEDIFECEFCKKAFAEIKERKGHKMHLSSMKGQVTKAAKYLFMKRDL